MVRDTRERTQWIDVAKFLAIVAVMTDHTYYVLYTERGIALSGGIIQNGKSFT